MGVIITFIISNYDCISVYIGDFSIPARPSFAHVENHFSMFLRSYVCPSLASTGSVISVWPMGHKRPSISRMSPDTSTEDARPPRPPPLPAEEKLAMTAVAACVSN